MRKYFFLFILLLIPSLAWSTTYFVKEGGTTNKAAATSYGNAMNIATHNASTFSSDDVIYLCDTITSRVIVPSSGTSGHVITYRGDYTDHTALMQPSSMSQSIGAAIAIYGKSYITLYNQTTRAVIDGQITSGTVDTIFTDGHEDHDLIDVTNSNHITIDNWELKRGYKAINSTGASDITITRCKFSQNRMGGVYFSEICSNITFGGSAENANEFDRNAYKTEWGINKIGADIYFYKVAGFVVSHNYLHGTIGGAGNDGWGLIGIAVYGANDGVIEYNTISYYGAKNFRGAIHNKGLNSYYPNYDVIIRYNNIYSLPLDPEWCYVGTGNAIVLTRDTYNYRIYGNRIHSTLSGIGMDINGEAASDDGANGIHSQDIYIWANSFSEVRKTIWTLADGYSGNTDDYDDIYFVNNSCASSINSTVNDNPIYSNFNYGTDSNGTDDTGSNPHVHLKNNILYEGRYGQATRYAIGALSEVTNGDWIDIDYNLGFDSSQPGYYSYKWGSTVYRNDSGSLPGAWGANDPSPANPLFIDVSTGNLRLGAGSPAIDAGDDLTAISIANITVEHYSGSAQTFSFNTILSPTTDWSTIPPTIATALQSEQTAPVIGAYSYAAGGADETAPTLLQGSVVSQTGTTLSLTFSEACTGTTGFTVTPSGGAATLTYSSGTGADRAYLLSRAIQYNETITLSYSGGNIQDLSSNALETITDEPVVNTSWAGRPVATGVSRNRIENATVNGVLLATINGVAALVAPADETPPEVIITNSDPEAIGVDSLTLGFTCTDASGISSAKWRIGSAPDGNNGTSVPGASPFSAVVTGFSEGANTLYAGCNDLSSNWGSDSITVNYTIDEEAECNATPYRSVADSGTLLENIGSIYYNTAVGVIVAAEQTSHDLCKVTFRFTKVGDVDEYTYTVRVYTLSSGNLSSLKGTSAGVTGNNDWSNTAVDFTFETPVAVDAGDAILVTRNGDNPSNYIRMKYVVGDSDSGYSNFARWRIDTGALVTSWDADAIGDFHAYE